MKLAIMQPYFFPYLGYFQLIHAADRFVLLDEVQYIRHGWINRNRILKPTTGFQYIIVPLEAHHRDTTIRYIVPKKETNWKDKILRQIEHYKKKAPYYRQTSEFLADCFFSYDEDSIAKLNGFYIKKVCAYIGIHTHIDVSSEMGFDYSNVNDAGEWALRICEQARASEYINPIGGIHLFDPNKFVSSKIDLSFLEPNTIVYNQKISGFEPGLSIIDVLMFNSPHDIRVMLRAYKLTKTSSHEPHRWIS